MIALKKEGKRKWEQEEELRRQRAITRHAPGYAGHVKITEKWQFFKTTFQTGGGGNFVPFKIF